MTPACRPDLSWRPFCSNARCSWQPSPQTGPNAVFPQKIFGHCVTRVYSEESLPCLLFGCRPWPTSHTPNKPCFVLTRTGQSARGAGCSDWGGPHPIDRGQQFSQSAHCSSAPSRLARTLRWRPLGVRDRRAPSPFPAPFGVSSRCHAC